MIGRRRLTAFLGASLLAVPAHADDFPTKPITLVVPFAPGGAIDMLARLVAQQASATLGQPIVIDNRSGAGGLIAAACGRQGRARRLHAADGVGGPGDDPALDQPVALLRSAARPGAGGAPCRHADGADRVVELQGADGQRLRRDGAGQSRRPQLRLDRRRHDLEPGHGEPEARGRHRRRARALSRRGAGAGRPACRPGAGDVHQHRLGGAHGGIGQVPAARRHHARRARRCCPTCRPWRRPAGRPPRSSSGRA